MHLILVFLVVTILFCSKKGVLHQLAIILLVLFFSSRNELVPDTIEYIDIYNNPDASLSFEVGYRFLCHFFKDILGLTFKQYLAVILFILLELFYYTTKKLFPIYKTGVLTVLLLSYFGFFYYGIVLRNSIAITISYSAIPLLIQNTNYKILRKSIRLLLFWGIVFFASLFHQAALLFVIVPFLLFSFPQWTKYLLLLLSSVLLFLGTISPIYSFISSFILDNEIARVSAYFVRDLSSDWAGVLQWYYVGFGFLFVFNDKNVVFLNDKEKRLYTLFLNLYIVGVFLNSALWQVDVAARFAMQILFFDFILFYVLVFRNVKTKDIYFKVFLFLSICGIQFFSLIHFVPLILNY